MPLQIVISEQTYNSFYRNDLWIPVPSWGNAALTNATANYEEKRCPPIELTITRESGGKGNLKDSTNRPPNQFVIGPHLYSSDMPVIIHRVAAQTASCRPVGSFAQTVLSKNCEDCF